MGKGKVLSLKTKKYAQRPRLARESCCYERLQR